jgi:hypothetical protein
VLASLESFEDNRELAMGAFSLLSKLTESGNSGQKDAVQMLRTPEAKEKIMNAINMYAGDVAMRTVSANIINQIAGPTDIAQAKADMKAAVADIASDESGDAAARARKALQSLSAFAIAPQTGMMVMEENGLQSFVDCLKTVAMQQEVPGQQAIISLSTASINALLQNTVTKDAVVAQCDNGKLIKAISTSIKMNPSIDPTNSMRLMRTMAAERTLAPVLISNGGVEAVVACVRGNQENPEAVAHGVEVLQRIAAQGPEGIQKVVRKGGVRMVTKLLDNSDTAFDKTRVPMLELLKQLASSPDARNIMIKQGVKDSVVRVMAANPTHVEIQNLGGHIIRDCTTENDLYACAEALVQQATQKNAVNVGALLGNLGTMSSMAQAGDSAKKLVESGSAQTMVAILADVATWEDEDARREVISATALALGSIASKTPLPGETQAVPWLLHTLKITESPVVVDALTAVAQTKANVDSLVTGGGVETIVAIMQKHEHDKVVSTACYQALAMIARGGPEAVQKISQAGGLVLAKDFLENGTETASPAQIRYATELMAELCSVGSTAAWIDQQGGIEAVFDIVDQECSSEEPDMAIVVGTASSSWVVPGPLCVWSVGVVVKFPDVIRCTALFCFLVRDPPRIVPLSFSFLLLFIIIGLTVLLIFSSSCFPTTYPHTTTHVCFADRHHYTTAAKILPPLTLTLLAFQAAGISMLGNSARTASVASSIAKKGDMRRLLASVQDNAELRQDPKAMKALMNLLQNEIMMAPESVEVMMSCDVGDLVMETMATHASDADIADVSAGVLKSVISVEQASGMVTMSQEKVNQMLSQVSPAQCNPTVLASISDTMSDMASMMMVDGVMSDQAKVESMLATVNNAVAVTGASVPTQQKLDVLEVSIDTIGRLSKMGTVDPTTMATSIALVAASADDDPKLMTAAVKCIDSTITDAASISALEEAGCIDVVRNALLASAADPKLASATKSSMAHLSKVAIAHEASMAPATMAKILDAQAGDADGLLVMVDELADLGAVALLECMALNPSDGLKVEAAATKSITRATNNGAVEVNAITQGQMRGIVSNMRRAQKAKSDRADEHRALIASGQSAEAGGSGNSAAASQLVDNSMDLLALAANDESQAISMAKEGGVEELLAVLESKDSTGVQKKKAAMVLKNMAKHNNADLCSKMVQLQISSKIAAALRDVEDEDFAHDALTLLQSITSTAGAEEAGLDEEDLKIISVVVENQSNKGIGEKGAALLDSLSSVYKAESADAITSKVEKAVKNLSSLDQYEEVQAEDGRTYYVNRTDNTTSWEMPQEMAQATKQFQKIAELGETHAENMVEVDQKSVETCVQALAKLANKPTAAATVCDALSRLVTNDSNAKIIANADGIRAVVHAMRANPNLVPLLISCFRLLNQFAKNDHYKKVVAAEGGIVLVIHAMTYHYQHNILMKLCLSVVANMAFNSAVNITALVTAGAIDCIERVMQNYEDEGPILELCMVALSNLMHNNDEVRITVGQTCGDEVVHIIRRLFTDASLVKSAMRAIGNLSFCDQNIRYLVSEHATEVVVKSMQEHPEDTELLQLAIDVIGNLASLDFDDDDDDETERIHAEVYDTIFREGGPTKILEILRSRKETSLLLSGMDALSNIANDQSSVEQLLSKGLVELVLESMQANDWDEELSECTVKLLASISAAEECANEITSNNGVQLLLTAMEAHEDQPEFLVPAHIAMSNVVIVEEAKNAVVQLKGGAMFCKQLEEFSDNEELAEKIIETLIRMSADDEISAELANTGMITFVDLIDQYKDDVDMLTLIFMFLGHLAFVTGNLKAMVASGAVKKIVMQMRSHPDELELMVK